MLNYRRETALQGALVVAWKTGTETERQYFYGQCRSIRRPNTTFESLDLKFQVWMI